MLIDSLYIVRAVKLHLSSSKPTILLLWSFNTGYGQEVNQAQDNLYMILFLMIYSLVNHGQSYLRCLYETTALVSVLGVSKYGSSHPSKSVDDGGVCGLILSTSTPRYPILKNCIGVRLCLQNSTILHYVLRCVIYFNRSYSKCKFNLKSWRLWLSRSTKHCINLLKAVTCR